MIFAVLLACSPYKKVTVTKSDQLTKRWKGATEQEVLASVGPYQSNTKVPGGYIIRYEYSYILPAGMSKSHDFQVKASNQNTNPMVPSLPQAEHKSADDSVIRRMDFYLDASRRVQYVNAEGFPDSVYQVKRK